MKVSLCIPTRGRPGSLSGAVAKAVIASELPDTRIVIGYDEDDEVRLPIGDAKVISSVAPREDSVGAKYNRLFRACDADLYVQGVDDLVLTQGWDRKLAEAAAQYPDQIGAVYYGANVSTSGMLPSGFALTRRFLELIGGFPECFAFWWYDTWIHEIATMTGCIVWADIDVELIGGRGKTRGCRDVDFWARLFDETRANRIVTAAKIIGELTTTERQKAILLCRLGAVAKAALMSGANLRQPDEARAIEAMLGYDAPPDARYLRIKAAAEKLISEQTE